MAPSRIRCLRGITRLVGYAMVVLAPLAACSGDARAVIPTAPTTPATVVPQPAGASSVGFIRAYLSDPAGRPLAGGRVEALDGASAGAVGVANSNGVAVLNGNFTSTTRF